MREKKFPFKLGNVFIIKTTSKNGPRVIEYKLDALSELQGPFEQSLTRRVIKNKKNIDIFFFIFLLSGINQRG